MTEGFWRPTDRGPIFTVVRIGFDGKVRDSWQTSLSSQNDEAIEVEAFANERREFADFVIEKGDRIRQLFPFGEWFYIQRYMDSPGRTKGWYCNIGTPAEIRGSTITVRDLILDIFVDANRKVRLVDEEELEEKRNQIPATTMTRIDEAREKLLAMIESKKLPFD